MKNQQIKDDLIKGFYNLFSSSEKNSMGVHSKKGSEIKTGLTNVSIMLNTKKAECLDMMNAELSKINFKPDKPCDDYSDFHHLMDCVPKKFSWDLLYQGEKYVDNSNGIGEEAVRKPTPEEAVEMKEYNRYARAYVEYCVYKLKVDSLRNNIQDNKSYQLSIDQLAVLGL